jgi:hypothetical protein
MNEAVAVAPRPTSGAVGPERLLQVVTDLSDEVGRARGQQPPGDRRRADARLSTGDEQLVVRLRVGLGQLAAAAGSEHGGSPDRLAAVRMRLDAAESVMRRKIQCGQAERLPQLLPSFIFLAVLPLLGQTEALRVSGRAAQLLEMGA